MTSSFLQVVEHPLLQHKLTLLRDENTPTYTFRKLVYEITLLLGFEATKRLSLRETSIKTPMKETINSHVLNYTPVIIPILRAGLPMAEAMTHLMPDAKLGHIGLARDETTHESHCYYFKIPPESPKRAVFLVDPMLATGGSAVHAISLLKEKNVSDITLMCLVGVSAGVERVHAAHPDVPIFIGALDRELNENAYILPGLGDAGDRVCGT